MTIEIARCDLMGWAMLDHTTCTTMVVDIPWQSIAMAPPGHFRIPICLVLVLHRLHPPCHPVPDQSVHRQVVLSRVVVLDHPLAACRLEANHGTSEIC